MRAISAGMSASTSALKVGISEDDPVPGPASTVFTATSFHSNSKVPEASAGDPVTLNRSGASREIEMVGTSSV